MIEAQAFPEGGDLPLNPPPPEGEISPSTPLLPRGRLYKSI